jgi:chemotaxis signal transduction protein
LAYEVDAVLGIEEVDKEHINKMPNVAANEETSLMELVLRINSDIVIAINADKVLSDEITEALNQMMEENEQ